MTIITGFTDGKNTWLAGDRIGASEYGDNSLQVRPKVFTKDIPHCKQKIAIGYTTSFRMGQLLEFKYTPPVFEGDIDKYIFSKVTSSIMNFLHENKFASESDNVRRGGNFLIGFMGRLFEMQNDFSVLENTRGYAAVGCGFAYALGAMCALVNTQSTTELKPMDIAIQGVAVAAEHNSFCKHLGEIDTVCVGIE